MTTPAPAPKKPIEKKVTWSAAGAYLAGLVGLAVLQLVGADPTLISGMPDWLEAIILPMVPAAISFLTGYNAKHTPRPDLASGAVSEEPLIQRSEGRVVRPRPEDPFDRSGS